jgi:hypothetical protein
MCGTFRGDEAGKEQDMANGSVRGRGSGSGGDHLSIKGKGASGGDHLSVKGSGANPDPSVVKVGTGKAKIDYRAIGIARQNGN